MQRILNSEAFTSLQSELKSYDKRILASVVSGLVLCYAVFGVIFPVVMVLTFVLSFCSSLKFIKWLQRCSNQRRRTVTRSKDQSEIQRELRSKLNVKTKLTRPWNEVQIPATVDAALDALFEEILQSFVLVWEKNLGNDQSFSSELRFCIRYLAVNLHHRLSQVNLEKLIQLKALPTSLHHIDNWVCSTRCLTKWKRITHEEATVLFYGEDLHPALKSRECEVAYLRNVVQNVLELTFRKDFLQSKIVASLLREIITCSVLLPALDAAANPDYLNTLLLLLFESGPMASFVDTPETCNMLEDFQKRGKENWSNFMAIPLSVLLKDFQMCQIFKNVLKREEAENYLSFCEAVDDVNEMLMNADMTDFQLLKLHKMALDIYNGYFTEDTSSHITFTPEIVKEMKEIVEGPSSEIVKLRVSRAWFLSYDYAYGVLEKELAPRFYESPDFISHFMGRRKSFDEGILSEQKSKSEGISINRIIGQKIKGVLKTSSPVEGKLLDDEETTGQELTESADFPEDLDYDYGRFDQTLTNTQPHRDLSTWRLTIPRVVSRKTTDKKQFLAYEIEIQRSDLRPEDNPDDFRWSVERQYAEFYNLEDKLTKFHGVFHDVRLPAKRIFGFKGAEYLESKRTALESYLRSLLQMPTLKGSDQIFTFLTLDDLSSTSGGAGQPAVPDLGLGRIIKNVPAKLRGEKGQCLEQFLTGYFASTEVPRPKPSRLDVREANVDDSIPSKKDLSNVTFGNNAYEIRASWDIDDAVKLKPVNQFSVRGYYEAFVFLCARCFKLPDWFMSILVGIQTVVSDLIDLHASQIISSGLSKVLVPARIAILITLIQEAVFGPTSSPSTDEEKTEKAEQLKRSLKTTVPHLVRKIFGSESLDEGIDSIHRLLQSPILNKQLVYTLVDLILEELFPELFEKPVTTYHVRTRSSDFRL